MAEGHKKREIPHRETHRTSNCPVYMFIMDLLCGHYLVLVRPLAPTVGALGEGLNATSWRRYG